MKIKHYGKSWPSSLKIPFTKKERNFFRFLELSSDFEKQIADIRKKYKIPAHGFSTLKENEVGLGIPKYLDYNKWDEYLEDESTIEDNFGFVGTWRLSLTYFIKYNYMPKMADEVVPRASIFDGETTLQMLQNYYPSTLKRCFSITLSQKLSKEQLKSLVDLQWDQISKQMEVLPVWDRKKHTNIKLYKEIALLKEKGDLPWEKIMSILGEKYPEIDKVHDEPYLRMLHSRYTKRLERLSKDSASLRPRAK